MSEIADGQDRQLDPRVIPLRRLTGGLRLAAIAVLSFAGLLIGLMAGDSLAGAVRAGLVLLWTALVGLGAWHAIRWPARAYAHTFYRVDERGLEIRRGVYWRIAVSVPRSRVQHIDVTQGPLERRFGLGTLVVHTAGTDHALVAVDGLEHGRALAIREHLLPAGAGDAV